TQCFQQFSGRGGDSNPAKGDLEADRPWRDNQSTVKKIRADWLDGESSSAATAELLEALRHASAADASAKVVELLNRRIAPQSIWDGIFDAAGEDRKSTRLNSSHVAISYAVFCLKKKKNKKYTLTE